METVRILYTDRAVTAAVKEAGVLSQPDETGAPSMLSLVSVAVSHPVFPVHRLDRAVGGVMLFAGTDRATAALDRAFAEGRVCKEYAALVHGIPDLPEATLEDSLLHDARRNLTFAVDGATRGAKRASLSYRLLRTLSVADEPCSLLLIRLHTGRTHQIRVQFASRGLPLLGDGKYGAHDRCPLGLWSYRITLRHPVTDAPLRFSAVPTAAPFDALAEDDFPA